MQKEITLNLRSRPLRLAYLVEDLSDLKNAVKLYTHIWGGSANAIVPISNQSKYIEDLKLILEKVDPDYVFVTQRERQVNITEILKDIPLTLSQITEEETNRYIEKNDEIKLLVSQGLSGGHAVNLPRTIPILKEQFPSPLTTSELCFAKLSRVYELSLMLQSGAPSEAYQKDLVSHLGSKVLSCPSSIEELFKTSLVLATSPNPISLTMNSIQKQTRGEISRGWLDNPRALCLFLAKPNDLRLASAFWNNRWHRPRNKLFLPKNEILKNLESCIEMILEVMPEIEAIYISITSDKRNAERLLGRTRTILSQLSEKNIKVRISYDNFYANLPYISNYYGTPTINTQVVYENSELRFIPPAPNGLVGNEFNKLSFGYDVELSSVTGLKIIFPRTKSSSFLLSNPIKSIIYHENNESLSRNITSINSARATIKGIAGATFARQECKVCLHSAKEIISRFIKEKSNLVLQDSRPTRYANGFVNRLGGLTRIFNLVNKGGIEVLLSLNSKDASQSGLEISQITNFLRGYLETARCGEGSCQPS